MTATRDSDRILRAWLDLVPDEAPDRVLDAVLDQIDHTPQVRRAGLRGQWRFPEMPRFFLAGAAVVLALVLGAIALAPRPAPGVGGSSTPALTPPPSTPPPSGSVAAAGAVPAELRNRWMGGSNSLVNPNAGSSIVFGPTSIALAQANSNQTVVLTADAAAAAAGRLRLTTGGAHGVCPAGTAGTYDWTLSPSGRVLSINIADDPCADRSDALIGTWWLMGCKDVDDNCLGLLDAGTYASQFINLRNTGASWAPDFGAVTFAVPDGWANNADWPAWFGLTPKAAFDRWTKERGVPSGLDVLADVSADVTDRPCASTSATGVPHTPEAIIASLRNVPGLVVMDSATITVGGHRGTWVDLAVDDAKLKPCDNGERVVEFLFAGGEGQTMAPGERVRLIVLAGTTAPVAIRIVAPAADFDAIVPPAMRIVESMTLK
jgi:hypothetical protein